MFRKDLKCLVDCCEADCWMNLLDFALDSLRGRMISAMKGKSTDRYPLRSSLVSFLSESFDYQCVWFVRATHIIHKRFLHSPRDPVNLVED